MLVLRKVFNLGCVPEANRTNFTVPYEPPTSKKKPAAPKKATVPRKPEIFSSTLLQDQHHEETPADNFPTTEKLLKHAEIFVNWKIRKLPLVEDELRTMYSILEQCMNERVAMHIWSISKATKGSRKTLEDVLKKNYMSMLKSPEWNVKWSQYQDLTDHPYFPKFYQCQLKSDFIYRNNSHENFMKMKHYLNYLLFHSNAQGSETFNIMLQFMKENFNEFMVRDLLALFYHSNTKFGTESMEEYLMAKYQFKQYNRNPGNFDMTNFYVDDENIKTHPHYIEYYMARLELEEKYKFAFDPFYLCYKQMADYWIEFRLKGKEKLPEFVKKTYCMLEENMSSTRAHELFLISQYRNDTKKIQRMERYLFEKYRKHVETDDLYDVAAECQEEEIGDSSFFASRHPSIHDIIKTNNLENPVYTQEIIDTVIEMLIKKKKVILSIMEVRKLTNREKHHGKLFDFFYNRPNEEKIRELYAMHVHGIEDWEDVFYEKYKFLIKALENFPIVQKFTI